MTSDTKLLLAVRMKIALEPAFATLDTVLRSVELGSRLDRMRAAFFIDRVVELDYPIFFGHNWLNPCPASTSSCLSPRKVKACQCRKARVQRNYIACALLVWTRRLKAIAYQSDKTVYQVKHGMLSDYLIEQFKHPSVQMTLA